MNVIVCIKQVPAKIKIEIDPKTGSLISGGVDRAINPPDLYALEEGLRIKERTNGKVTVLTVGPLKADESLKEAIGYGADEAILLSDPAFEGSDTWATSHILSKAIRRVGEFDLVICGKQSIDGETGQVGAMLAEALGVPFIPLVNKIEELGGSHIKLMRMSDEGHQLIEMALPGVISVVKEINVPRIPSLRGLMAAKKAKIPVWDAQALDVGAAIVGSAGSPCRVARVFFPHRAAKGEMLQGQPESQVDQLVEKLRQAKAI
ncbi:MAG: electron transfer flavoprotein subunit beta/FixA family protein [Dehalococcoidia bacterium]|nr:electron transfer flavoprotein subunit beta/FixA family protein [Dehalococcoidia bacterium]